MPRPLPPTVETFPLTGASAVNWDYTTSHALLTRLYENAKRDQWNAATTIPWDRPVDPESEIVTQCKSGVRSAKAADFLRSVGFRNVLNLKGGILDWVDKVDPSQPKY